MAGIERLTITLPSDMAILVKGAVAEGDYVSSSEVIREALREWKLRRELQLQKVAALKLEIDRVWRMLPKAASPTSTPSASSSAGGNY